MRTVSAEVRRFLSRRAVVLLLLLGVVVTVVVVGVASYQQRPVDEAELARAQAMADRQASQPYYERRLERCLDRGQSDAFCGRGQPQVDWFLDRAVLEPAQAVQDLLPVAAGLLGLVVLIAGTSFVGAEYGSGSLSNLLLFEPRRLRVWFAKVAAATGVATVYAAVLIGSAFVVLSTIGLSWQDSSWTGSQWWHWTYFALRCVVLVAGAAAFGTATTLLLRSTVATVGAVLVYLLVGEAILRAIFSFGAEPWLASNRVIGFVLGHWAVRNWDGAGRPDVMRFTLAESATVVGIAMVVVLAVSALAFRRRDVP